MKACSSAISIRFVRKGRKYSATLSSSLSVLLLSVPLLSVPLLSVPLLSVPLVLSYSYLNENSNLLSY